MRNKFNNLHINHDFQQHKKVIILEEQPHSRSEINFLFVLAFMQDTKRCQADGTENIAKETAKKTAYIVKNSHPGKCEIFHFKINKRADIQRQTEI